jgi:hypothetical protein
MVRGANRQVELATSLRRTAARSISNPLFIPGDT